MKRILTAAALLLVVAACNKDENYNDKYGDRAVIPPKGQSLRVMTYNIYGARATSPANAADLDAIAEVIRRQNPDFVTLNEVDVFQPHGQGRAPGPRSGRKARHGVALLEGYRP